MQPDYKLPEKDITITEFGEKVSVRELIENGELTYGHYEKIADHVRYLFRELVKNKGNRKVKSDLTSYLSWMFVIGDYFYNKGEYDASLKVYEDLSQQFSTAKTLHINLNVQTSDQNLSKSRIASICGKKISEAIKNGKDKDILKYTGKLHDLVTNEGYSLEDNQVFDDVLSYFINKGDVDTLEELISWSDSNSLFSKEILEQATGTVNTARSKEYTEAFNDLVETFEEGYELGDVEKMRTALLGAMGLSGLTEDLKKKLARYWIKYAYLLNSCYTGISPLECVSNYGISEDATEKEKKDVLRDKIQLALQQIDKLSNDVQLDQSDLKTVEEIRESVRPKKEVSVRPTPSVEKPPWESRKKVPGKIIPDVWGMAISNDPKQWRKAADVIMKAYDEGAEVSYRDFMSLSTVYLKLYSRVEDSPYHNKMRKMIFDMAGELLSTVKDLNVLSKYKGPLGNKSGLLFILERLDAMNPSAHELIHIRRNIRDEYAKGFMSILGDRCVVHYSSAQLDKWGGYGYMIWKVGQLGDTIPLESDEDYKNEIEIMKRTIEKYNKNDPNYDEAMKVIQFLSKLNLKQFNQFRNAIIAFPPPTQVDDYLTQLSKITGVQLTGM